MTPKTHSIVWLVVVITVAALVSMASHTESTVSRHEWRVESLVPDLWPPVPPMPRVVSIEGVTLEDNFGSLERRFGKPISQIIPGVDCAVFEEQCFKFPEGTLTARAVSNEIYRLDGHRLEIDGKVLAVPGTERSEIVKVLGESDYDFQGEVKSTWYFWDLGLGLRFRGTTFESAWVCSKFHDPHGYLECCPPSEQFTDPENSSRCER